MEAGPVIADGSPKDVIDAYQGSLEQEYAITAAR